jgi:hypothetical protein
MLMRNAAENGSFSSISLEQKSGTWITLILLTNTGKKSVQICLFCFVGVSVKVFPACEG